MASAFEIVWMTSIGATVVYALARQVLDDQREGVGRIRRTPRSTVGAMRAGEPVRLCGRVEVDEGVPLLRAPLSGQECVGWRVTVSQAQGRGSSTILDEHEGMAFWLRDETGRALVRGRAIVWPHLETFTEVGHFDEPDEDLERFLREHRQSLKGVVFTRQTTFEEGVIVPGDRVAVAGLGGLDRSLPPELPEGGYREDTGSPVVGPLAEGFVVVSNRRRALR